MGARCFDLAQHLQVSRQGDVIINKQEYWLGNAMERRLFIHSLLGLILLDGGCVFCQTAGDTSIKPASQSVAPVISPCKPDAQLCKDQIMALEEQMESILHSSLLEVEIMIQRFKKGESNRSVPDAVNYYQGVAEFGKRTKFHKISEKDYWRTLWWDFNLAGFLEMSFLDPYYFNKLNYELEYRGEETTLGRPCWVYRVTSKEHAKGWHFEGTIWVLPKELTIIRFKGAFHPLHKILWFFLVKDYWFCFDSWRKEISPGSWVPDSTCTGVNVAKRDSLEPAFRARIVYFPGGSEISSAGSENVCEMEFGHFPTREIHKQPTSGVARK